MVCVFESVVHVWDPRFYVIISWCGCSEWPSVGPAWCCPLRINRELSGWIQILVNLMIHYNSLFGLWGPHGSWDWEQRKKRKWMFKVWVGEEGLRPWPWRSGLSSKKWAMTHRLRLDWSSLGAGQGDSLGSELCWPLREWCHWTIRTSMVEEWVANRTVETWEILLEG